MHNIMRYISIFPVHVKLPREYLHLAYKIEKVKTREGESIMSVNYVYNVFLRNIIFYYIIY